MDAVHLLFTALTQDQTCSFSSSFWYQLSLVPTKLFLWKWRFPYELFVHLASARVFWEGLFSGSLVPFLLAFPSEPGQSQKERPFSARVAVQPGISPVKKVGERQVTASHGDFWATRRAISWCGRLKATRSLCLVTHRVKFPRATKGRLIAPLLVFCLTEDDQAVSLSCRDHKWTR